MNASPLIASSSAKWIDDLTVRGQRALSQPGRPRGHRRLQVGDDPQSGQHVIGSHGRGYLPYDKVHHRTLASRRCVRYRTRFYQGHCTPGVETPTSLLGQPLDQDLVGGQEGVRPRRPAELAAPQAAPPAIETRRSGRPGWRVPAATRTSSTSSPGESAASSADRAPGRGRLRPAGRSPGTPPRSRYRSARRSRRRSSGAARSPASTRSAPRPAGWPARMPGRSPGAR